MDPDDNLWNLIMNAKEPPSSELMKDLFPEKPAESTNMSPMLNLPDPTSSSNKQTGPSEIRAPVSNEMSTRTPMKKRQKLANAEEGTTSKRCRCKKTQCSNMKCQCFAAFVPCMEQCLCEACLNKPIHRDTMLATLREIQSQNPMAFAPQVIRNTTPLQNVGLPSKQDDSTRTPPSARQ